MSVFKRYNLVDEDELSKIKWPLEDSVGENKDGVNQGLHQIADNTYQSAV